MTLNVTRSQLATVVIGTALIVAFVAGLITGQSTAPDAPVMPRIYEDGSGTFRNGQAFCLTDHLCDRD